MIWIPYVGGAPATALAENEAFFLEALERGLHRRAADARTELENLGLGENSQSVSDSSSYDFIWGALAINRTEPILEVPIAVQDNTKKILDEGDVIILTLMPPPGDFPQHIVVRIFGLLDLLLDADVLAHKETALVQQQRGKQPAHPSIAVIERMDT